MTTKYILSLIFVCLSFKACAFLDVFDSRVFEETMKQRSETIKQWALVNENKLKELEALNLSNDLSQKNFEIKNKKSWDEVKKINESSLSFLVSVDNLWGEYKNANLYLSSAKKNEALHKCLKQKKCNLKDALSYLDNASVEFASNAYKNTELVQNKLKDKIKILKNLSFESQEAEGLNSIIDTMSKINADASDSLNDLNLQINTMLKIFSHNMIESKNDKILKDKITDEYKSKVNLKENHININILHHK